MSHTREVIAIHEGHGEEAICAECYVYWPCQAEQLRAVKADAWDKGWQAAHSTEDPPMAGIFTNPYRFEGSKA